MKINLKKESKKLAMESFFFFFDGTESCRGLSVFGKTRLKHLTVQEIEHKHERWFNEDK